MKQRTKRLRRMYWRRLLAGSPEAVLPTAFLFLIVLTIAVQGAGAAILAGVFLIVWPGLVKWSIHADLVARRERTYLRFVEEGFGPGKVHTGQR